MRVGVDTLAFAENERRKFKGLPILRFLNRGKFAEDVVRELTREAENGDTPIYLLLDSMIDAALNSGSTHALEVEPQPQGSEACASQTNTETRIRTI